MKLSPRQKRWAAAGASLAAGTVVLQLRHARQIARDPQKDLLSEPPRGRPPRHLYRLTSAGEAHLALLEEIGNGTDGTSSGKRRVLGIAG